MQRRSRAVLTPPCVRARPRARTELYGPQHAVNLVNQHGRETIVGQAYKRYLEQLQLPSVQYAR